ncbi:MAG: hypothetical protein AXW16_06600 [Cycloclasticus sp. Phe_18]|nr:MAG: hypothetical protein AXW16_06600 [Cycloclasticus sp. Phe_18]
MLITISASKALTKWLQIELPRIPSPDGKRVGTQPLVTDSESISWQCHVVQNYYQHGAYTVIAVEAYSRFTLLLPFNVAPTQKEFEQRLCEHWASVLVSLMVRHGDIDRDQVPAIFSQCQQKMVNIKWCRNTDLSVNGHVSDAEQWVKQTIDERRVDALSVDEAFDLAMHINQFFKNAKDEQGKKQRFYPIPRFVEDGLYRFASALLDKDVRTSPYLANGPSVIGQDNVVSLADYRVRRAK